MENPLIATSAAFSDEKLAPTIGDSDTIKNSFVLGAEARSD
jgi:hypothetical protein